MVTIAICGLLAVAVLVLGAHVFLLAFAGILLAIFLRALANGLARATGLPAGFALAAVVLLLLALVIGFGTWMAPSLIEQIQELSQSIPQSLQKLRQQLEHTGWGRWLLNYWPDQPVAGGKGGGLLSNVATFVSVTVGNVVNLVVIVFVGLYLSAQPALYLDGVMRLVPQPRRARLAMVLNEVGYELRWWLIGQVFAMFFIATLVTTGLWMLGLPMALLLGIIAGLLNFVPNFGPIISAIPAVLIALTTQPALALWVVALYVAAQHVETYLVTPMIQQRNVDLAPAITITTQVLMGLLIGALGVTLATPLVIVAIVLIKMLYVEDLLGDRLALPGDNIQKIKDSELT